MKPLQCPDCGDIMILKSSDVRVYKDGTSHLYWSCAKWPNCRATVSANKNGLPIADPADKKTREARIEAHKAFDHWWQSGKYTRSRSYQMLANKLNLPRGEAHIGKFNYEQCQLVIELFGQADLETRKKNA